MRVGHVGLVAFAFTLFALGLLGLDSHDFTPVWQPGPKSGLLRLILVYLCAGVSIVGGLGLVWGRTSAGASRILVSYFLLWLLLIRLPDVFPAPAVLGSWFGVAETLVFLCAAWVLYAELAGWDKYRPAFATGDKGVQAARMLYAPTLIFFGSAHFVYRDATTVLIPHWFGFPVGWAYFTGGAYILAGIAILVGFWARLAAVAVTVQMGLFTLLVWIPIIAAGSKDPFQWSETILSWAMTAAAWVIADSYRDVPRFAINRR